MLSFMIATLMLSSVIASPQVSANSLNEMKVKKQEMDQKKNELNSGIKKKTEEIDENKSKISTIKDQISKIDSEITTTNNEITRLESEIAVTIEEIEKLQASIADLEKKIEERDVVLRDRVRAMQANGDPVDYLDVLLGANSFADFIDRFSTVTTLLDADRTIMKQQADDQKQLEEEKVIVEQKLAELEGNKAELEGLKNSLQSQKSEKDRLVHELNAEQEKLSQEKAELETAFHETHEMSKELEAEIAAEQQRQLEAARRAEEERKRQLAANNSGGSGSSSAIDMPVVSSGSWTRPTTGRSTSPYGMRKHPVSGGMKMHYGADIANSAGTPIVAAADGVVFRAGWHSSYGNHVMITHSINGQVYTTVYAHLSSLNVNVGQVVNKGQYLGGMGATGRVTGVHLHFELYRGPYSYGNAINPVGIVY